MSANTKMSLLEQLQAKKITVEEYVAQTQVLNKQEEEEKLRLKEENAKLKEENAKLESVSSIIKEKTSLYDEVIHHYVQLGDVTYFVELCNFFVDIVAKELKYVPSNMFAEKYAEATVDEVLGAFAALQHKKKKDGNNNLSLFPSKKKMKFTINNVEYPSYSDYFIKFIKEVLKTEEETTNDDDLF